MARKFGRNPAARLDGGRIRKAKFPNQVTRTQKPGAIKNMPAARKGSGKSYRKNSRGETQSHRAYRCFVNLSRHCETLEKARKNAVKGFESRSRDDGEKEQA